MSRRGRRSSGLFSIDISFEHVANVSRRAISDGVSNTVRKARRSLSRVSMPGDRSDEENDEGRTGRSLTEHQNPAHTDGASPASGKTSGSRMNREDSPDVATETGTFGSWKNKFSTFSRRGRHGRSSPEPEPKPTLDLAFKMEPSPLSNVLIPSPTLTLNKIYAAQGKVAHESQFWANDPPAPTVSIAQQVANERREVFMRTGQIFSELDVSGADQKLDEDFPDGDNRASDNTLDYTSRVTPMNLDELNDLIDEIVQAHVQGLSQALTSPAVVDAETANSVSSTADGKSAFPDIGKESSIESDEEARFTTSPLPKPKLPAQETADPPTVVEINRRSDSSLSDAGYSKFKLSQGRRGQVYTRSKVRIHWPGKNDSTDSSLDEGDGYQTAATVEISEDDHIVEGVPFKPEVLQLSNEHDGQDVVNYASDGGHPPMTRESSEVKRDSAMPAEDLLDVKPTDLDADINQHRPVDEQSQAELPIVGYRNHFALSPSSSMVANTGVAEDIASADDEKDVDIDIDTSFEEGSSWDSPYALIDAVHAARRQGYARIGSDSPTTAAAAAARGGHHSLVSSAANSTTELLPSRRDMGSMNGLVAAETMPAEFEAAAAGEETGKAAHGEHQEQDEATAKRPDDTRKVSDVSALALENLSPSSEVVGPSEIEEPARASGNLKSHSMRATSKASGYLAGRRQVLGSGPIQLPKKRQAEGGAGDDDDGEDKGGWSDVD